MGLLRRSRIFFSAYCAAGLRLSLCCFYFKAFFVLLFIFKAFFGAGFLFCKEHITSFENSIETVAVFLCLRTKQASNSSKRERKFPVTLATGAKHE